MEQLKLEDFLQYNYLSNLQLSEDESKLFFVSGKAKKDKKGYKFNLYYFDGKKHQLTQSDKASNYVVWDDNTILYQADGSKDGVTFNWIDVETGEVCEAFTLPLTNARIKKINDSEVLVVSTINKNYPDLYKAENRKELLEEIEDNTDYEVLDESPFYFNNQGFTNGNRTALFSLNINDVCSLTRLTSELTNVASVEVKGNDVYFLAEEFSSVSSTFNKLYKMSYSTKEVTLLFESDKLHVEGMKQFKDGLMLVGSTQERFGMNENSYLYFFDLSTKELSVFYENEQSFGSSVGSDCRLGGGSYMIEKNGSLYYTSTRLNSSGLFKMSEPNKEETVFLPEGSVDDFQVGKDKVYFVGMLDNKLQEIYCLDLAGNLTQLTTVNQKVLENKYVADYQEVTTVACDTKIYGWVLKPKDFDPTKKYPAILDVHGGPKTVYGKVFYHEMQYWANKGYFVMFCNPIGGDGRGNEFADIRGKYGTIDYDTLMAFVDEVLKQYPNIDQSKVCETGGSYGGFMTNWIIGHTDRFCATASQRSISNWLSFAGVSDIGYEFGTDQCGVNNVIDEYEKLWDHSPLKFANKATTPTLFIHSDEDYRCPMEQALQMFTALVRNGIESRVCYFHKENHELSRGGMPKHRIRRLKEITDWFDKHIEK